MKRNLTEAGREEAMRKGTLMLMLEDSYSIVDMIDTVDKDIIEIYALLAFYNNVTESYAKQYKKWKRSYKRKYLLKKSWDCQNDSLFFIFEHGKEIRVVYIRLYERKVTNMTLKIAVFDKCSVNWTKSRECNIYFLHYVQDYINGVIKHRGYMYLNQICEHLGVEWNPDWDNPCIRNDERRIVNFSTVERSENSFLVNIQSIDQF